MFVALGRLPLVVCVAAAAACASTSRPAGAGPSSAPAPAAPAAADAGSRLFVVMINGGGSAAQNYQSHLLHVRELLKRLDASGLSRERVTIFSSDGSDPTTDLAMREIQPEADFWLLEGTRLHARLRTPVVFANSSIGGADVAPATKAALGAWFRAKATGLRAGDTLLIYVTDHGTRNDADPTDNRITLWGKDETLSVRELRAMLEAHVNPAVRVVTLMSQCFSGSFANLYVPRPPGGEPTGAVCGYFSSTADRPAYGCYPENRDLDNVGHSFAFMRALAASARVDDAHDEVLVTDDTPDVPLRSSDVYLDHVLRKDAAAAGLSLTAMVDDLLRQAWKDRAAWTRELRLLDRIAAAFGHASPRSLAELDEQVRRLSEVATQIKTHASAWKTALGDAARANLDRFLGAHPAWAARTTDQALGGLGQREARPLTVALLAELAPFTRTGGAAAARLDLLAGRRDTAAAVSYRMEVRVGVVLRMRAILTTIAGRVHLARPATSASGQREAYEALRRCEDLTLAPATASQLPHGIAGAPAPAARGPGPGASRPFPSLDDDLRSAQSVLPAWLGVGFRDAPDNTRAAAARARLDLPAGASVVTAVFPGSPAAAAGIVVGDVVIGPPGAPFSEPSQIRTWTMLSAVDEPRALDVIRGTTRLRLTIVPKPYPVSWPALPGPPKVGTLAPPLRSVGYRGSPPTALGGGTPYLLYFWATWCQPCKAALPEVMAYARARNTAVIAITDESADELDRFFKTFAGPFPDLVVMDEIRGAFLAYGVRGTPTFVLVDGGGTVRGYTTGYAPAVGLGIEGWRYR